VALGLGNELAWFISPTTWAKDVATLHTMVAEIFPVGRRRPQIFAPCNANGDSVEWGGKFLDAVNVGVLIDLTLVAVVHRVHVLQVNSLAWPVICLHV
jgi:hypothetical protein